MCHTVDVRTHTFVVGCNNLSSRSLVRAIASCLRVAVCFLPVRSRPCSSATRQRKCTRSPLLLSGLDERCLASMHRSRILSSFRPWSNKRVSVRTTAESSPGTEPTLSIDRPRLRWAWTGIRHRGKHAEQYHPPRSVDAIGAVGALSERGVTARQGRPSPSRCFKSTSWPLMMRAPALLRSRSSLQLDPARDRRGRMGSRSNPTRSRSLTTVAHTPVPEAVARDVATCNWRCRSLQTIAFKWSNGKRFDATAGAAERSTKLQRGRCETMGRFPSSSVPTSSRR